MVRPLSPEERDGLTGLLTREWGSPTIISRGQIHDASRSPALGCFDGGRLIGLVTYDPGGERCEILTLNAFEPGRGVGSRLLAAVSEAARVAGCGRLRLITTNDNLEAVRFYERRGLRLVAVHHGAVDEARKRKPEIPEFSPDGIRISDELEFELELAR
jgi:ribosomal protein S18 acetylase RimI-like enzyme